MLGQILVDQGALQPKQLDAALREQERRTALGRAIRLGELLLEQGVITSAQLKRALAERAKLSVR